MQPVCNRLPCTFQRIPRSSMDFDGERRPAARYLEGRLHWDMGEDAVDAAFPVAWLWPRYSDCGAGEDLV